MIRMDVINRGSRENRGKRYSFRGCALLLAFLTAFSLAGCGQQIVQDPAGSGTASTATDAPAGPGTTPEAGASEDVLSGDTPENMP